MEVQLSKNALISWINEITKSNTDIIPLKNLEELSNGVHFCYLLNIMTDGKFKMEKINQQAKLEREKLQNLKHLIVGMEKNNIQQMFDITKISNKNYQEILHMLQWFHKVMEKTNFGGPRSGRSVEKVINFKVKAQTDLKKPIKPRELKKDQLTESKPITISFIEHRSNNLLPLPTHRQEEEPTNERVHSPLTDVCPELWKKTPLQTAQKDVQHISKETQNQPIANQKSPHSQVGIKKQVSNEKQEPIKFEKSLSENLNLLKEQVSESKFSNPEQKPTSDRKFVTFHKSQTFEKSIIDPARSKEERPASKQKSCLKSPAQTVKLSQEKKIQSIFTMNYEVSNSERSALLTPRMI